MARLRKAAQILSALAMNANLAGFAAGRIWQGQSKRVCVPGLNCYSCPAAVGACPLGALQFALATGELAALAYVLGITLALGAALGRFVCGFLCPFGFIQELINAPFGSRLSKRRVSARRKGEAGAVSAARPFPKNLNYAALLVFVIAFPLAAYAASGLGVPAFCKYICPAGTLEAGLPLVLANAQIREAAGGLFLWKLLVLACVLAACIFIYRPFCRICPLGAIYGLCNRTAAARMTVDSAKCSGCGACAEACPMQTDCASRECVRCGRCVSGCSRGAVGYEVLGRRV